MPLNRRLSIGPPDTTPPPNRGRLMDAFEVAAQLFHGKVEPRWVLEHCPLKVRFGHRTVFFYENDVRAWIDEHRVEVA